MWCDTPDSHHGIRPPAVKKSAAVLIWLRAQTPMPTISRK